MPAVTQDVETILRVSDLSSGPLSRIGRAAGVANNAINRITGALSGILPLAGAAGAALTFKSIVSGANDYIKRVREIKELTGASAEETDYLFSSARKSGVEYGQMESIMRRLSMRGSQMEMSMGGVAAGSGGMAKRMARMGVDLRKGPVESIRQMSKGVKAGTISAAHLMKQFGIPPAAQNDFQGFLEDLDEAKMKQAILAGGFLTNRELTAQARYEKAQHRIADAWNRVKLAIGAPLIDALGRLLEGIAANSDKWVSAARKFGEALRDNMDKILFTAKAIVAVLAAKKAVGLLGAIPGVGKVAGAVAGRFTQSVGAGMAFGGKGAVSAVIGAVGASFATFLPIIAAVAVVVGGLALAFRGLQRDLGGAGTRLSALWETITTRFSQMYDSVSRIVTSIASIFGITISDAVDSVEETLAGGVVKAASGFNAVLRELQIGLEMVRLSVSLIVPIWKQWWEQLMEFDRRVRGAVQGLFWSIYEAAIDITNKVRGWVGRAPIEKGARPKIEAPAWLDDMTRPARTFYAIAEASVASQNAEITRARAATRRADEATAKKQPSPYNDYRGSRFDITQNFAEGFDPDRIAVAFASDVAAMGEKKSQSGFTPLFAMTSF